MKTNFTFLVICLLVNFTNKAFSQITQTCFFEDFNSQTSGWSYSQGAKEGDYNNPNNVCVSDRGIITPGVGGNNPANIITPQITAVGGTQVQLSFDIYNLDANLNCSSWQDYTCPTSIDVFYHVGAMTYTGIKDLVLPHNGPANYSRTTIVFNVGNNLPVGTLFSVELAFKPKSGIGNCVQSGVKNVIDNLGICQVTCVNCTIDAINDNYCLVTNDLNVFTGDLSINDLKYSGAVIFDSLANGPFANGSSTVGGATLIVHTDGTFIMTRTDSTKSVFDFTYKMTDTVLGLTDLASAKVCFSTGNVLPVVISSFYSTRKNNLVTLNWKTETENNIARFEIQKKSGDVFETVATVSADNITNGSVYSYNDPNNSKIVTEYRLRIIDKNNNAVLSNIITVNGIKSANNFIIYPNPGKGGMAGVLISDVSNPLTVRVIDNSGRVLKNFISVSKNSLSITGLQRGIYLIRLINQFNGEAITKKLIIE